MSKGSEGPMAADESKKKSRKEKAKHELKELMTIFVYLAFFFCALVTYSMLLLNEYHIKHWDYAFALINALVITKVIMIGEYAKVGKRYEAGTLFFSAIWKAFIFTLLVFAFHVVEEIIKRLIHGDDVAAASRNIRFDKLAGASIVIFCTFIPLFAFREFRRVMGEREFQTLLFGKGDEKDPAHPTSD